MRAARRQAPGGGGKGGRPTKFRAEFVEIAGGMARLGATDIDIAKALGVSVWTLWRWQSENEAFCKALAVPFGAPDDRAERSLFQRAVGYSYDAEKIFQYEGAPVRVPYTEHIPPDTNAAIKWLANRRPDRWREKQTHELTGKDGKDLLPEASPRDIARAVLDIVRQAELEPMPGDDSSVTQPGPPLKTHAAPYQASSPHIRVFNPYTGRLE